MTTETTTAPTPEQLQADWDAEVASRNKAPGSEPDAPADAGDTSAADDAAAAAAAAEAAKQPTVEDRIAALETGNAALQEKLLREQGRTSALQKKLDSGLKAAKEAGTEAPTKSQQEAAIEDPAEWKQLMEEFPEWGTAVQKKLNAELDRIKKAQPATAAAPSDELIGTAVQTALEAREFARTDRKHPGWRDLVKTDAFVTWHKKQPPEVQALADSDDSDDAINLLNSFKADDKKAQADALAARRKHTLTVAAGEKPNTRQAPVPAADGDLDPKAVWEAEKRQRDTKRRALA